MYKVAFWYDFTTEYTGGLNYIKNLLHALSLANKKQLKIYVFLGTKVDSNIVRLFEPYATVVKTSVIERGTIPWFIHKVLFKFFGSAIVANALIRKYGISAVFSHAGNIYGKDMPYKLISWVPDFQYLHLPEFFPGLNIAAETSRLQEIARHSDLVVLSSRDALGDYGRIVPKELLCKARVLPFVSQPDNKLYQRDQSITAELMKAKYGILGKFFFLPNQFWAHKNHMAVFEAVKLLKDKGREVLLVCTGNLYDYRLKNASYSEGLSQFVLTNGLQDNIKILGLIDYPEVLYLMRNSIAALNPSKFEGWSSTVEESKSIGKSVILSRIGVHLEQAPPGARYFEPDDVLALSRHMSEVWDEADGGPDFELEEKARQKLHDRTVEYGQAFINLITELDLKEEH